MFRPIIPLLVCTFVLGPIGLHAEEHWSQLKLGLTADETAAKLGAPMLRSRGRGFEVWTYDNGAEVLLYGSLVGWTAPGKANVVERSMDVWRENRSGTYFPTFLALLPQPVVQSPPPARVTGSAGESGTRWLPIPVYRRR